MATNSRPSIDAYYRGEQNQDIPLCWNWSNEHVSVGYFLRCDSPHGKLFRYTIMFYRIEPLFWLSFLRKHQQ